MTKNKRFTPRLYETLELFLEDNETNCFYRVEDSFGNVELLCERLNKLVDENESLKQFKEKALHEVYDLNKENEQLKQRINSRLHFYRELYDSTNDSIVKRVVEDLEDILKE